MSWLPMNYAILVNFDVFLYDKEDESLHSRAARIELYSIHHRFLLIMIEWAFTRLATMRLSRSLWLKAFTEASPVTAHAPDFGR